MKTKQLLTALFSVFVMMIASAQTKYKISKELDYNDSNKAKIEQVVSKEFGASTSPDIWSSNDQNYTLLIRVKNNKITIRATEIKSDSGIEQKLLRMLEALKKI